MPEHELYNTMVRISYLHPPLYGRLKRVIDRIDVDKPVGLFRADLTAYRWAYVMARKLRPVVRIAE